MVEPETTLIVVVGRHHCRGVERRRNVAERIELESIERDGIEQRRWKFVSRNRVERAGLEVETEQWPTHLREIALALGWSRHNGGLGFALAVTQALVVREEEIFVAANGAADGGAELVLVERLNLRSEKVSRIQVAVPQEFIEIAVNAVT